MSFSGATGAKYQEITSRLYRINRLREGHHRGWIELTEVVKLKVGPRLCGR